MQNCWYVICFFLVFFFSFCCYSGCLDYFISCKISQLVSYIDNNVEFCVDQFLVLFNNVKQSYDQYMINFICSYEYVEMVFWIESMSGQMSEDLLQQFVNYVQKYVFNDVEFILMNINFFDVVERYWVMVWVFVQE